MGDEPLVGIEVTLAIPNFIFNVPELNLSSVATRLISAVSPIIASRTERRASSLRRIFESFVLSRMRCSLISSIKREVFGESLVYRCFSAHYRNLKLSN